MARPTLKGPGKMKKGCCIIEAKPLIGIDSIWRRVGGPNRIDLR